MNIYWGFMCFLSLIIRYLAPLLVALLTFSSCTSGGGGTVVFGAASTPSNPIATPSSNQLLHPELALPNTRFTKGTMIDNPAIRNMIGVHSADNLNGYDMGFINSWNTLKSSTPIIGSGVKVAVIGSSVDLVPGYLNAVNVNRKVVTYNQATSSGGLDNVQTVAQNTTNAAPSFTRDHNTNPLSYSSDKQYNDYFTLAGRFFSDSANIPISYSSAAVLPVKMANGQNGWVFTSRKSTAFAFLLAAFNANALTDTSGTSHGGGAYGASFDLYNTDWLERVRYRINDKIVGAASPGNANFVPMVYGSDPAQVTNKGRNVFNAIGVCGGVNYYGSLGNKNYATGSTHCTDVQADANQTRAAISLFTGDVNLLSRRYFYDLADAGRQYTLVEPLTNIDNAKLIGYLDLQTYSIGQAIKSAATNADKVLALNMPQHWIKDFNIVSTGTNIKINNDSTGLSTLYYSSKYSNGTAIVNSPQILPYNQISDKASVRNFINLADGSGQGASNTISASYQSAYKIENGAGTSDDEYVLSAEYDALTGIGADTASIQTLETMLAGERAKTTSNEIAYIGDQIIEYLKANGRTNVMVAPLGESDYRNELSTTSNFTPNISVMTGTRESGLSSTYTTSQIFPTQGQAYKNNFSNSAALNNSSSVTTGAGAGYATLKISELTSGGASYVREDVDRDFMNFNTGTFPAMYASYVYLNQNNTGGILSSTINPSYNIDFGSDNYSTLKEERMKMNNSEKSKAGNNQNNIGLQTQIVIFGALNFDSSTSNSFKNKLDGSDVFFYNRYNNSSTTTAPQNSNTPLYGMNNVLQPYTYQCGSLKEYCLFATASTLADVAYSAIDGNNNKISRQFGTNTSNDVNPLTSSTAAATVNDVSLSSGAILPTEQAAAYGTAAVTLLQQAFPGSPGYAIIDTLKFAADRLYGSILDPSFDTSVAPANILYGAGQTYLVDGGQTKLPFANSTGVVKVTNGKIPLLPMAISGVSVNDPLSYLRLYESVAVFYKETTGGQGDVGSSASGSGGSLVYFNGKNTNSTLGVIDTAIDTLVGSSTVSGSYDRMQAGKYSVGGTEIFRTNNDTGDIAVYELVWNSTTSRNELRLAYFNGVKDPIPVYDSNGDFRGYYECIIASCAGDYTTIIDSNVGIRMRPIPSNIYGYGIINLARVFNPNLNQLFLTGTSGLSVNSLSNSSLATSAVFGDMITNNPSSMGASLTDYKAYNIFGLQYNIDLTNKVIASGYTTIGNSLYQNMIQMNAISSYGNINLSSFGNLAVSKRLIGTNNSNYEIGNKNVHFYFADWAMNKNFDNRYGVVDINSSQIQASMNNVLNVVNIDQDLGKSFNFSATNGMDKNRLFAFNKSGKVEDLNRASLSSTPLYQYSANNNPYLNYIAYNAAATAYRFQTKHFVVQHLIAKNYSSMNKLVNNINNLTIIGSNSLYNNNNNVLAETEVSFDKGKSLYNIAFGTLNETSGILGMTGTGAMSLSNNAKTSYVAAKILQHMFGKSYIFANYYQGFTNGSDINTNSIFSQMSRVQTRKFAIGLFQKDFLGGSMMVAYSEPLRVVKGGVSVLQPVGYNDAGTVDFVTNRASLTPQGREKNYEFGYSKNFSSNSMISFNFLRRLQPNNIKYAKAEEAAILKLSIGW